MGERLKKSGKHRIRKDLLDCHWTGRILGGISQRLDCAGGDLNKGDFESAEHNIYQAKLELKESSWVIGKSTSSRLSKLLDEPHQALKKAQQAVREGKQGRFSKDRLRPFGKALVKAMDRASNKCQ